MASFFGEIIEPSTRALFGDCSDEESDETYNINIVWKPGYTSDPPSFRKFVVVDGIVTLAFAEAYLLHPKPSKHTIIGEIHVTENLASTKELGHKTIKPSPLILQGDLLICFVQPSFPASAAFDFTDLVARFFLIAEEVIILTSQPSSRYKSPPGEISPSNAVYAIVTSSFKRSPLRPFPAEANIITGIPAGVASFCETKNIPAVAYICYADSEVLDSLTAQPLLGIFPQHFELPDLKTPRHWLYGGVGPRIVLPSNMYM